MHAIFKGSKTCGCIWPHRDWKLVLMFKREPKLFLNYFLYAFSFKKPTPFLITL